ncbi:hypothetical protein vBBcePLY3_00006 [Bacillus phage vB_BceP_LY3]|uniref:Uncharacterized protein n=1 Tax=Bacillus phage vB_BceP_LY3 TaxID=2950458 RepID=A0AAE9LV39_9CAUD|nr:hypothetical protein vBBcePLY3_00006 [Bacillus phage vB_BceP_LY3]
MCMKQMSVKETYDKLGVEKIIESGVNCRYAVLLSDHLKVVEEKGNWEESFNIMRNDRDEQYKEKKKIEKELKEKDEKYLKVVDDNTHLLKTFNGRYEIFKKELKEKDEDAQRFYDEVKKQMMEKDEREKRWEDTYNRMVDRAEKMIKDKDEEIEKLREYLKTGKNIAEVVLGYHVLKENLDKTIKYNHEIIENNNELRSCITETGSQNDILQEELEKAKDINVDLAFENKELKEENKRLKENNDVLTNLLKGEEVVENLWVLEYVYKDSLGIRKNVILDPQPKEELEEIIGMDSNNWVQYKMMEVQ